MKLTAEVSEILDRANKKSESGLAKLRTAALEMFGDDQSLKTLLMLIRLLEP